MNRTTLALLLFVILALTILGFALKTDAAVIALVGVLGALGMALTRKIDEPPPKR